MKAPFRARFLSTALFLAGAAFPVLAAPTLSVGDPAPKLRVGKWVQGDPVAEFARDKAYIVEFWATWCGPCRVSIPHLNEIHKKFKDQGLVVIGQDCWENDESLVGPFIEKMGEKMTYRVALDDHRDSKKGWMATTWMEAAGQNGIPSAFLVDKKGTVAWVGHPMQLKEDVIEAVLKGTHDIEKAKAAFLASVKEAEEWRAAQIPRNEVLVALRKKDWATAEAKLAAAEKVLAKEDFQHLRLQILLAKKDYTAVVKSAGQTWGPLASPKPSDSRLAAMRLNEIAWRMAVDADISQDDLAHAATIAKWADDATQHSEPMILDTLARVLFRQKKVDEAIAIETKAAKLGEEPVYKDTLESYKKGILPESK